ncbi:hypothetical protein HDU88_001552 [Geranomyces variabilis]|nr:hypothetical protein HDU88_001552 [Geranomyces variabilis]
MLAALSIKPGCSIEVVSVKKTHVRVWAGFGSPCRFPATKAERRLQRQQQQGSSSTTLTAALDDMRVQKRARRPRPKRLTLMGISPSSIKPDSTVELVNDIGKTLPVPPPSIKEERKQQQQQQQQQHGHTTLTAALDDLKLLAVLLAMVLAAPPPRHLGRGAAGETEQKEQRDQEEQCEPCFSDAPDPEE